MSASPLMERPSRMRIWIVPLLLVILAATARSDDQGGIEAGPLRFEPKPRLLVDQPKAYAWNPSFSPDGKLLAVGYGDWSSGGRMQVWDLQTQEVRFSYDAPRGVRAIAFSPDGKLFATGNFTGEIMIRETASGQLKRKFHEGEGSVDALCFTADGSQLFTASNCKMVRQWDVATGKELKVFAGHQNVVYSVALSSDEKLLVSCGRDRTARVVELRTQKLLQKLTHPNEVSSAVFTPDGKELATGCIDGNLRFWDLKTGKISGEPIQVSTNQLYQVAFSPDGRHFLTTDGAGTLKLWDSATRKVLHTGRGHTSRVVHANFSADGKRIASGDFGMEVRLWDAKSLDAQEVLAAADQALLLDAAYSPDQTRIAVASESRHVKLLDADGKLLHRLEGFDDLVSSVAFSPDGKQLATASFDHSVKLWDCETGKFVRDFQGHDNWVYDVTFSADGRWLVSCGYDQTIRVWDSASGESVAVLRGHGTGVRSVDFSADGRWLASGGADGKVVFWDARTWSQQAAFAAHPKAIRDLAFNAQGLLASASEDATIRLWEVKAILAAGANGAPAPTLILQGHAQMVWSVDFAADGRTLASSGPDKSVRLWDIRTAAQHQLLQAHTDAVCVVRFSKDSKSLLSAGYDQSLRLWSYRIPPVAPVRVFAEPQARISVISPDDRWLLTGSRVSPFLHLWDRETGELRHRLEGHLGGASLAVFSPDSKQIVTSGFDKSLRIWDVASGEPRGAKRLKQLMRTLAYSPDGSRLACGGWNRIVQIWDMSKKPFGRVLVETPPQPMTVNDVAFSPDGTRFATAVGDFEAWRKPGEVKLWETATAKELATLGPHAAEVKGLDFSPDGSQLATFGSFTSLRIWDLKTRREVNSIEIGHVVARARFMPDGTEMAIAGWNGAVGIWDLEKRRQVVAFQGHAKGINDLSRTSDGRQLATCSEAGKIALWATDKRPADPVGRAEENNGLEDNNPPASIPDEALEGEDAPAAAPLRDEPAERPAK